MNNNNDKIFFNNVGSQMDFITASIQKREKETAERNDHDDQEKISNCCSALVAFDTCLDCKEKCQAVSEEDEDKLNN